MPVLVNNETGMAEDLQQDIAQRAIQSQSHALPLLDPEGNHVLANHEDAAGLLQQGYTQPNSEQLQGLLDYSKYSTPAEQVKTFAEGAGAGATFGLSTAVERGLGVKPEDINKRREVNPITHMAGEVTGFGATSLTGFGAGALAGKAGVAMGAATAGSLGKIGSVAARMAAENALFTAGDEASQFFANDPHQSIESTAMNIGLSGLIGAAAGGALKGTGELWAMGPGKKLANLMQTVSNKAAGLPSELKLASGIELEPEMMAALSTNPEARAAFQTLQESNTKAGLNAQAMLAKFNTEVDGAIASTLGKTADDVYAVANMSKAEQGKAFQDSLANAIESKIKPISEQYNLIQERFASSELSQATKTQLANDIASLIGREGLEKGADEAGLALAQKAIQNISKQGTIEDLRKYAQSLSHVAPFGSEKYYVAKQLRNVFADNIDSAVESGLASKAPEMLDAYKATNSEYGKFKDLLSELNDRLRLGKEGKAGATSFVEALRSSDPESVVSRLSLKGDTNLQKLLAEQFPEAANIARSQELNSVLKTSIGKSGDAVDAKKFFKNFAKLEPELKNYLVDAEGLKRIEALEQLVNLVPTRMNTSGTAKTLDALWNKLPASASAVVAMMSGNNPLVGYLLGKAGNYLGKEIPDAVRMSMLKFLGSDGRISAQGLRAATKLADNSIKGEAKLSSAIVGLFDDVGVQTVPLPDDAKVKKLSEMVDKVAAAPEALVGEDNHLGQYMQDHAVALGTVNANAISYLASLRPSILPEAPLNVARQPSKVEEQNYKAALVIAEQPLVVLQYVKEGSVTPQDMQHLQNLYPGLMSRMQVKMIEQMSKAISEEKEIPYKTKMGMSLFLHQPLESSMMPAAIQSAQPLPAPQQPMSATSSNNLMKLPKTYATPAQSREATRQGRR